MLQFTELVKIPSKCTLYSNIQHELSVLHCYHSTSLSIMCLQLVQSLKDQFNDDKEKVEGVVKRCGELLTTPHDVQESLSSLAGPAESSVDVIESSVDALPTPAEPSTVQGEGLKELQEAVKSLEEECAKVEEKLRDKAVTLADRKTAVVKYDDDFNNFHRGLDGVAGELSNVQPVLNDDDAVKEQIEKTEVSDHYNTL